MKTDGNKFASDKVKQFIYHLSLLGERAVVGIVRVGF